MKRRQTFQTSERRINLPKRFSIVAALLLINLAYWSVTTGSSPIATKSTIGAYNDHEHCGSSQIEQHLSMFSPLQKRCLWRQSSHVAYASSHSLTTITASFASDRPAKTPSSNNLVCKRCGAKQFRKKGKGEREGYEVQKYQCKSCGKYTSDNPRKQWTKEEEAGFVDAYYHSVVKLDKMTENVKVVNLVQLGKLYGLSKPAMSRRIRKIVASMEDGLETTRKKIDRLDHCLVVDSKHVKIKGNTCYCWLAVDASNGEPIHFALSTSKEKEVIRRFLSELRFVAGYKAKVIIADKEESILDEGGAIFTEEATQNKPLLQACTVHRLRQIAKKWRYLEWQGKPDLGKRKKKAKKNNDNQTFEQKKNSGKKRKGRPLSPEKAKARIEFSELAAQLVYSGTIPQKKALEQRIKFLEEKHWPKDKVRTKECNSLMSNLQFYHTADELGGAPFDNNKAETLNGILKKKLSRMQGFKTVETGRLHLKGFWQTYRKAHFADNDTQVPIRDEDIIPVSASVTHQHDNYTKVEMERVCPSAPMLPAPQILLALPSPSPRALPPASIITIANQPLLIPSSTQEHKENVAIVVALTKPPDVMCLGVHYLDKFRDPKDSMPAFIKETHYEILHLIKQANSTNDLAAAKDKVKKILQTTIDKLHHRTIPLDELAITVAVQKPLSSYTSTSAGFDFDGKPIYKYKKLPPQMRAAKMLMEVKARDFKIGEVVVYIMTINNDGVKPLELAKISDIDTNRYIEMVESSFEQILSSFGISFKQDILGIPKEQSLEALFWSN